MYGVVVCPRCKRAKGVNLKQKTTTCQCGFEIYVVPARIRARAVTARELAPLVGQVSAEIAGGTGVPTGPCTRSSEAVPGCPPSRHRHRRESTRSSKSRAVGRDRTHAGTRGVLDG